MPKSSGEKLRQEEAERQRKNEEARAKLAKAKAKRAEMQAELSVKLQEADFHRQQRADESARRDAKESRKLAWVGMWIALVAAVASVLSALAAWYAVAKP